MRKRENDGLFLETIASIEIDVKSRDDVPALLLGLQHIYVNDSTRKEVMNLLQQHVRPDCDHDNGRPGMTLWQILVVAVIKQGLDCDYDRLQELVNQHRTLRQMLQHNTDDLTSYTVRTLQNNVQLLSPDLLEKVNAIVVREGLAVAGKSPGDALAARVDSFVVKSNVHHPTDLNLLWDAMRASLRKVQDLAAAYGLSDWRQTGYWRKTIRRLFQRVARARHWNTRPDDVRAYLDQCVELAPRMHTTLHQLEALPKGPEDAKLQPLRTWLQAVTTLSDQVERRVLNHEQIPQTEKLFSIFEPYTRWIAKGKAGVPVELGVPLTIVEEASGFILHWALQWEGGDVDIAVPLVEGTLERFPDVQSCSFDRGFHSQTNQTALGALLTHVTLPVKGHGTLESKAREADPTFVAARRQHPAVESAIHALTCHGLERVRNRGRDTFERTVCISILGANLHRLGRRLQAQANRKRRGPLPKAA